MVQVAIAAIRRVGNALKGAFNTIKDFEQANVNLATILGKSIQEVQALTKEAERLGRTTEYTASEVTGLQIELAKLGFSEGQIQVMEESVLHFATAVGADLSEAATLAGSTLRMFGLSTKDTEDVLATLALATNKSALSFSFFESAMSTIGPVAKTFGFGIKDTTALLGTLANAGFDASSAATATRNILLNLADANGKLAKALGGPVNTFDELIGGLHRLNEKGIDLAGTLELTDKRSVAAFNTFLQGADAAKELRTELENTDGVLKDIAEQRMNTLDGSLKKLSSAWEGFILKMKNSTGVLKSVVDWLTNMVSLLTPGHKHDTAVENAISEITNLGQSSKASAEIAEKQVRNLETMINRLDSDLENAADKRTRKQIEKEKKRIEGLLSVRREAYNRLKSTADVESQETTPSGEKPLEDYRNDPSPKGGKTWTLQSDRSFLVAKAELTRQYNDGQIKSQEEFEDRLYLLEISSLQARLNLHKESGAARQKIEADIQDKTMAHNAKVQKQNEERAKKEADEKKEAAKLEEQALQAQISSADNYNEKAEMQLKAENARFEKELKQYEAKKDLIANYNQVIETLERQHSNYLLKIELDRTSAEIKGLEDCHKLRLAEIQKEDEYELSLETTSASRRLEIHRRRNVLVAEENKRFLDEQYKLLLKIVDAGEVGGIKLSMEQMVQYQTKLAEIGKQLQDADAAVDNLTKSSVWSGTGDGALFGIKQSDWDTFFANLADGTLKAKDLQTMIGGIGGAAQEGFKLANQAMQLTAAKEKKALDTFKNGQDDRKKELEARFKAGLMTEHQYNEAVEQMEADMQAKQEEMELREAMRTKKMSIIESIINTALGVTKTLAQWGIPAGIAPAAIMTAMGAAQTAMIVAQPVGYAEGGDVQVKRAQDGKTFKAKVEPDKRGYVDKPTILVGEEGGEYVIPADGLKNPDIRNMADIIEYARRTGQLRSLRMEVVSPAYAVAGRADGGYTQETLPAGSVVLPSGATVEISRLAETVDRLSSILDAGIAAEVVMLGRNGLIERLDEYNRAKKRGQL